MHCFTLLYSTLCLSRALYSNNITTIQGGSFAGLGNLTTLCVAMRSDVLLPELTMKLCRHLYFNNITSVESGDFAGLSLLTNMYFPMCGNHCSGRTNPAPHRRLDFNKISSIESGAFSELTRLQDLFAAIRRFPFVIKYDYAPRQILKQQSNHVDSKWSIHRAH